MSHISTQPRTTRRLAGATTSGDEEQVMTAADIAGTHAAPSRPPAATRAAAAASRRQAAARPTAVLRRVWSAVSTVLLLAAAAAFLLLAVGPHVFGYRTATMLTGSMAPQINPGDVVVTVPKPVSEVAVGDIISYHIPVEDHRVETHRVVAVTHDANGRLAVITKGDANNGRDPWVATIDGNTVWQTKAVVPYVGSWIRTLRAPLVQGGVFWGALGAVVLIALWRIWATESDDSSDE
jgi:signal peptidase